MDKHDEESPEYYVGGKCYSPDQSKTLCSVEGIFERVTLYQSQKGAFFKVRESIVSGLRLDGAAVEVLSEAEALSFIDQHCEGINKENYLLIFGDPLQG